MSRDRNDERLREAWNTRDETAAAAGHCPADAEIWDLAHGDLDESRVAELLDHTRACASCAESLRVAAALRREMPRRARGMSRWIGFAAAAAVVLGVVWVTVRPTDLSRPPVDRYRNGTEVTIRSELEAGAALPADRFELRWSGAPEGSVYTVEVATEELEVLHRASEVAEPRYRVPQDALDGLAPGSVVLWRVDAVLPDASRSSSDVFRARLDGAP